MVSKSYLAGGRIGDFIHSLCVCKRTWEKFNTKADIFISNQGDIFLKPLKDTVEDLLPVLSKQEWFNSIDIYNNQKIDINLIEFRKSPLLYKTCWIDLYFKTYFPGEDTPKNYSWISIDELDSSYNDVILINRKIGGDYKEKDKIYKQIIEDNKKCVFICFNLDQYLNFPFKDLIPVFVPNSLYDFFVKLNSCKLYVGNLTGPSAWATALDIPREIEISSNPGDIDRYHYLYDTEYYSNFKYF